MANVSQLKADVRPGDTIQFTGEGRVTITVAAKSGQISRLEIVADDTVDIKLPKRIKASDIVSQGIAAQR